MDPRSVREREAQCTQESPPACTAACPVHVDARALVDKVQKGDLAGGLSLLARHVPFPQIVARLCPHPCEPVCKRGEVGEPVRIGALERACAEHGGPAPPRVRQPRKRKRAAVVGGGLSGLAAAAELAVRGYPVEVLEAGPALLPRLRGLSAKVLPAEAIEADLSALDRLEVVVRCGVRVGDPGAPTVDDLAERFDAVYLAVGPGPARGLSAALALAGDGRIEIDPLTCATSHPKVFAGGSHRQAPAAWSSIASLQDGVRAAVSIDRLLQGASLTARREGEGPLESRLYVSTKGFAPSRAVAPADPSRGYDREEAVREAGRCLPCQCLECVKVCEYLAHYKSYPRRYIREIYNNDTILMGAHLANRMVNSCTLCGLCAAVCPEKLPMGEVCLEARQSMVAKGKMPPSTHEFALQDMAFSLGPGFALARPPPGADSCATLFFPGCQLSGSSPDQVAEVYARLRAQLPGGVGLFLGCCGAPARWAGREEAFRGVLCSLEEAWERLGRPVIVTACSSCHKVLREGLPQVPVEPLWTRLAPPPPPGPGARRRSLAIHDPCTTRGDVAVQEAVRRLLAQAGVDVVELNERGLETCCGFGGLVRFANPEVAGKMVRRRAGESAADYVTYCATCRDSFAREGKRALHLLDLLVGTDQADPAARPDPGLSRRRENRARLKRRLLREVWGEPAGEEGASVELEVSPEVLAVLERRMILVEDVRKVVEHAERTGQKLEDPATGHFLAAHRPVEVTYWVEYSRTDRGVVVHNAYSHRMQVAAQ
ncbi:MAG TPA: heterodisulfide reductase-related iron-sulfur binding cluster [Anaeromyxobacter sp.]|nr:heterodisulfide reductase-related iron-sulfur binding cluster [Anaeromyxobacter sp.]